MPYFAEYRGFEVHLEDASQGGQARVSWKVQGYGSERSSGVDGSRQDAFRSACDSIDEIEANPYRFPVNLLGYPGDSQGDVITSDGEVLGHWRMSGDEAFEFVEFISESSTEVLFRDYRIGSLCSDIREWHEGIEGT